MSVGSHTLKRRLARLETARDMSRARLEPTVTPEDRALMQRIIDRTYADPVGNADRIAMLERLRGGGGSPMVANGDTDGPDLSEETDDALSPLTPAKERAIVALLNEQTMTRAAQVADVSERSLGKSTSRL